MANKNSKKSNIKKKKTNKEESKDKKRREKFVVDTYKGTRGQKRVLNKKRHRGKHQKGTRK